MVWEAKIWDERKEAREEGLAEGLETGRAEGLAEGLATGRAEGRTAGIEYSAKRLLKSGMSADDVARILNIDADKVRGLNPTDSDK